MGKINLITCKLESRVKDTTIESLKKNVTEWFELNDKKAFELKVKSVSDKIHGISQMIETNKKYDVLSMHEIHRLNEEKLKLEMDKSEYTKILKDCEDELHPFHTLGKCELEELLILMFNNESKLIIDVIEDYADIIIELFDEISEQFGFNIRVLGVTFEKQVFVQSFENGHHKFLTVGSDNFITELKLL
jgi:hypothetical protein